MKFIYYACCMCLFVIQGFAQHKEPIYVESANNYRSFATKYHDLVHTKLEASFDYSKAYLNGKVWLTLQQHFYENDSVWIDAKGMNINKVALWNTKNQQFPLKYAYDSAVLAIKLPKKMKGGEKFTIFIDYTAKPNEFTTKGSAAITDAKGLYFINPTGSDKTKPTQIWTQGETEASSVWIPTLDKPNQKTTHEFFLTVPAKYVTLSNGLLVKSTPQPGGLRTDYWKMDKPHAPYLFFIGVGDYAVIKDSYKGKEVSYYVEKEYASVARKIFGLTPEMMRFFSEKVTGVEYPWSKYAQIVGRDYVSGAMENTTATLHQESAQQNARELVDGNGWESTIAHELFHHWFGDYVTAESWSNLTVNESFANYSETLWAEYKYGADAGADQNLADMQGYLGSGSNQKDLVRFFYNDKEDMFDAVSYNKGGRILHMLRHYVGDSAFFQSLKKYLTDNQFGTGNAHKLKHAFETVTGKDLNWYFNQWYFGNGQPKVAINYAYLPSQSAVRVIIEQKQKENKLFKMPISVDVYESNSKKRHTIWLMHKADTFYLPTTTEPKLVNVDAPKVMLWEKEDNKSLAEFIYQYNFAGNYVDRREAIDFCAKNMQNPEAFALLKKALNDPYYKLRNRSLMYLQDTTLDKATLIQVEKMAVTDANRIVRSFAINTLAKTGDKAYESLYEKAVFDSSYTVAGTALKALADINEEKAMKLLPELKKDAKGALNASIESLEVLTKGDADFEQISNAFANNGNLNAKFESMNNFILFLSNVNNTANFKKGVDLVIAFRNLIAPYGPGLKPMVNQQLRSIIDRKKAKTAANNELTTAINEQIDYLMSQTND
ncbi:MAG: M1 family aminopeptidase [Chitinophagaceae bacterium]